MPASSSKKKKNHHHHPCSCCSCCRNVLWKRPFCGGCCSSPCCLFRLPKVFCISPAARRALRIVIQYSLIGFLFVLLILWIGMEREDYHVRMASDTVHFYQTPAVCAMNHPAGIFAHNNVNDSLVVLHGNHSSSGKSSGNSNGSGNNKNATAAAAVIPSFDDNDRRRSSSPLVFETHSSMEAALNSTWNDHGTETSIAHCGDCGSCSTPHDIKIYDDTRSTLFEASVTCATRALFGGSRAAKKCMQTAVGFTADCTDCWGNNIMCSIRRCVFTCIWHGIFSKVNSGEDHQQLNRCTACDEKRCGPDFVTCAGANRRRTGILSDIERDTDVEVCTKVQPDHWWRNDRIQSLWQQQQEQQQEQEQEQLSGEGDDNNNNNNNNNNKDQNTSNSSYSSYSVDDDSSLPLQRRKVLLLRRG